MLQLVLYSRPNYHEMAPNQLSIFIKLRMDSNTEYQALLQKIYAMRNKGIKLDLTNVYKVLERLGNPQAKFRALHIAGTNGKGSVAAMTDSVLRRAGYRTGIVTSPHLSVFNERIRLNGENIADAVALKTAQAVLAAGGEHELTFFEIVTVMAFCIFAEAQVDFAVLETGMGGRLDATNVVTPLVALITNVSFDHTQWLGDTIGQIAFEKAGIIKPKVPVVTAAAGDALEVIKRRALELDAPLAVLGCDFEGRDRTRPGCFYPVFDYYEYKPGLSDADASGQNTVILEAVQLGLAGKHQIENAACVIRLLSYLQAQGTVIPRAAVRDGLAQARWPGRLEILHSRPLILLDGAHNPAGMRSLTAFINENGLAGKLTFVTGILADKEYEAMLDMILPLCKRVIFTRPANERALPAEALLPFAQKHNVAAHAENDVAQAIDLGLSLLQDDEALCVSGSLFLVGVARQLLRHHEICRN